MWYMKDYDLPGIGDYDPPEYEEEDDDDFGHCEDRSPGWDELDDEW